MVHTLTLNVPDEVFQPLAENAKKAGRTPEEVVNAWLAAAVHGLSQDRLLQWAGAITSELNDVADRHDDYLGQVLLKELRGEGHG